MDTNVRFSCCKIFILVWLTTTLQAESLSVNSSKGEAQELQKKQRTSQKTDLLNSMDNVGNTLNYTEPKQPEIGLKNLIKYDRVHKHFYGRSSMGVHMMTAPVKTRGAPWPMPKNYKVFSKIEPFIIEPKSLYIYTKEYYNAILEFNLKRLWQNVFSMEYNSKKLRIKDPKHTRLKTSVNQRIITFINITILKESILFPTSKMNEAYSLSINPKRHIELFAPEVWGAVRGLQTLSQLITREKDKFYLRNFTIQDSPRFSHRGLMIDTARHFISKDILIRNLEAMAQNKLNVFHWHMTDDQSFPFDSHKLPNITRYGAYNPDTHVYRHSDVSEVINEARMRGIRVIPEFDTPGHSFSWGYGQPDLLTPCFDANTVANRYFGPINPIREKSYKILETLYEEILEVFPDNTVHIGGDEVSKDCWHSNPEIYNYTKKTGLSVHHILSDFTARLQSIINTLSKKRSKKFGKEDPEMIVWQEAFDDGRKLTKNTIIQLWKNDEDFIELITEAGFKVIFSSCWYLDTSAYGIDWDVFYNCLKKAKSHPTDYDGLLIGGEICLWTEYIDDQNIMAKLWPRASAAAERLWSPANQSNFQEAAGRLEEHNCRMKRSGIASGVLNGPSFCGENLFADVTINITWPDDEPLAKYAVRRRVKSRPSHLQRSNNSTFLNFDKDKNEFHDSSFQDHHQGLINMGPAYTQQRLHMIVIIFVLVIFSIVFTCLLGIFLGIVFKDNKCPFECVSITMLLKRKVILSILIIGTILYTTNVLYIGSMTHAKTKYNVP